MLEERTPEREAYLIDQAAQYIVNHDLEDFMHIVIEGTLPFGDIVGELGVMMAYPLAVTFFSRSGADFINMFGFDYKVNANQLLKRVEELKEKRDLQRQKQKEMEKPKEKHEGLFSRIIASLRKTK
jgi:hypothetical protein